MILLRNANESDVKNLSELAKFPGQGFYGLPSDHSELKAKIELSNQSFSNKLSDSRKGRYLFVAEELETRKIIGTSTIRAQYGSEDSPNFYFQVGQEKKYSETIHTGFIHGTLILKYDTNGPSEIGGLVVHPEYRGTELKVGRQISFVRFMYMGLNQDRFQKKILTELLPPFNASGNAPLWEAIGRRFTNMEYWEADRLSNQSKEFILSLFPTGKIYVTFLPAEARDAIGKVGEQTAPVYHMLTKIGFRYNQKVDPFDGGPFMVAEMNEIKPIQKIQSVHLAFSESGHSNGDKVSGVLQLENSHRFKAIHVDGVRSQSTLYLNSLVKDSIQKILKISSSALDSKSEYKFMPYYH